MKVTKLIIKNIGKVADTTIEFNKPLLLFYGEIRQGKTTLLNAVRWVCGGSFPQDIIKHGEKEALIELHFDEGMIARSFYRGKGGVTKARDVEFVRKGKPVPSPVAEIKRMLNPFLLDQDFLRNKSETERRQYFTELFAVETTVLDTELFASQREAERLRSKIAAYGEIDLKKVEKIDVAGLKTELDQIKHKHAADHEEWEVVCQKIEEEYGKAIGAHALANAAVQTHNSNRATNENTLPVMRRKIEDLRKDLAAAVKAEKEMVEWLEANPAKDPTPAPVRPERPPEPKMQDVSELETKIQNAGAQNVRAEQYEANKKRDEQKGEDERRLEALETRQREIKKEKSAKLKGIAETTGIKGLEFDEAGNFIYQGTTAGMISDSQIMTLSSELSAMYPEGFGLELLDRGESLGKSIFEFVERAKAEEKTIMATIVGERPATVPENIGVFVVEEGKVTAAPTEPQK